MKDRIIISMTEEEKKSPVAKFYSEKLATPNPELMAILSKGPMDSKFAIEPENLKTLLEPGYIEGETGYCNLDNGSAYIAVNNQFPGCTMDMIKWWFAWHGIEGLRYKIWDPYCHEGTQLPQETIDKVTNPDLAVEDKIQDVWHYVVEDVGGGMESIDINFLNVETLGFSVEELNTAKAWPIGGNGFSGKPGTPFEQKIPAIMVHFFRETEGGIESRTRFWMGYSIVDGNPTCLMPPGITVPIEAAMGLAFHNVEEYSNLASLLPKVYEEFGSQPL